MLNKKKVIKYAMSDTSNYGNVRSRVQWESSRDGIENYLGCVTQSI